MKSAKKSVNHLILLLAIISVVNTNCAPIKRNWKSKTKKVTSTPGTPDAAPEKGTPADDSASNNSSEELDETIEVVAGEKPEKRETSGNSGTGDESADSAGSQTQENQLGESQTGEQESGEIDSSDDPVAEGTVDNTNAETAAEASAETGDAIVQSVMKADPILLIAGTPAGDDILKALEYKFEDGFYNLSPATQFLIISLVDETQKLTGGQSPLKLSFESLFSEPIEVAESTLLEMSEIRSLLDEEG
ncbi:MAG: hypothetical protein KDD25_03945, partial [Bdellovibrionales bacterium]|nr:hypothetical protein [Bdellovibrionales bacterium]